jgi:hypothetical protein
MSPKFKDIVGFEGYYKISNNGKILSISRTVSCGNRFGTTATRITKEKYKLPFKTKVGYWVVELKKNGDSEKFLVHRLVAQAFISNPDNLPEVNHKNCDKDVNEDWNLEWTDKAGNEKHAKENGRKKYKGNQHLDTFVNH